MLGNLRRNLPRIFPFVVFGGLWWLLLAHLSLYWTTNPEYSFGWFGPLLCAYLLIVGWFSRPLTGSASSARAKWIFILSGFALGPTWLVEQAAPDWRLISWLFMRHLFPRRKALAPTLCVRYLLYFCYRPVGGRRRAFDDPKSDAGGRLRDRSSSTSVWGSSAATR